ncbi:MAG: hypothetical protein D3916_01145 [Candidatus Electrothrix sp. MAN1_4]|nr:hypothetical protein [Candidatus Electrothrix sp. MAN1_4]
MNNRQEYKLPFYGTCKFAYFIVGINRECKEDKESEIKIFGTGNFFVIIVSLHRSGGHNTDSDWASSIL